MPVNSDTKLVSINVTGNVYKYNLSLWAWIVLFPNTWCLLDIEQYII